MGGVFSLGRKGGTGSQDSSDEEEDEDEDEDYDPKRGEPLMRRAGGRGGGPGRRRARGSTRGAGRSEYHLMPKKASSCHPFDSALTYPEGSLERLFKRPSRFWTPPCWTPGQEQET